MWFFDVRDVLWGFDVDWFIHHAKCLCCYNKPKRKWQYYNHSITTSASGTAAVSDTNTTNISITTDNTTGGYYTAAINTASKNNTTTSYGEGSGKIGVCQLVEAVENAKRFIRSMTVMFLVSCLFYLLLLPVTSLIIVRTIRVPRAISGLLLTMVKVMHIVSLLNLLMSIRRIALVASSAIR